ncbi:MAG: hypothetical protein RQ731_05820 [Anaerosomatales bacterium]|nr:hypothetical protein [Anaerosomatales bacterium]
MGVGAQSGFEVAFQEFVFYAGPIIQLAYWLVMIVAALWAVTLFKRWVEYQTGVKADAAGTDAGSAPTATATPVSVDEFVE